MPEQGRGQQREAEADLQEPEIPAQPRLQPRFPQGGIPEPEFHRGGLAPGVNGERVTHGHRQARPPQRPRPPGGVILCPRDRAAGSIGREAEIVPNDSEARRKGPMEGPCISPKAPMDDRRFLAVDPIIAVARALGDDLDVEDGVSPIPVILGRTPGCDAEVRVPPGDHPGQEQRKPFPPPKRRMTMGSASLLKKARRPHPRRGGTAGLVGHRSGTVGPISRPCRPGRGPRLGGIGCSRGPSRRGLRGPRAGCGPRPPGGS